MGTSKALIDRLMAANPRWPEWDELIVLVRTLSFTFVEDEYLGRFYTSDSPLTFADPPDDRQWPDWMPKYVAALAGMKADEWEMAGGYADAFCGKPAVKGAIFSPAGNDAELHFPLLEVPPDVFPFQSTVHGGTCFINKQLEVICPDANLCRFQRLDMLEQFTRRNISQTLLGQLWDQAYTEQISTLLD